MNSYSKTAVHAVVDKLMEIICEQDEEIRVLKVKRPTPRFDALRDQMDQILDLAGQDEYVSSRRIFAIHGGRDVH